MALAGSYLSSEVVVGEALFTLPGCWVRVPADLHDGALIAPWVFLICGSFLRPGCEVFQHPFRVYGVLPVSAILRSPSERWFTKLLQVHMPLLMCDGGTGRTVVFLHSNHCVGQ